MQCFPAGEGLWPRRKWCYMLVKQLQHHTAFLVSKLVLLILFFECPLKEKVQKLNQKKNTTPIPTNWKKRRNLAQFMWPTGAPLRPLCLITHPAANQNPAVCGVSQTGCQSVDWRISLLLNPIQRACRHGNAEHLRVPVGNLWNHILKTPARKTSQPCSLSMKCESFVFSLEWGLFMKLLLAGLHTVLRADASRTKCGEDSKGPTAQHPPLPCIYRFCWGFLNLMHWPILIGVGG